MPGPSTSFTATRAGPNLWGQVKKITVADGAPGDYFGTSLSLNEQFLLVGANRKNLAGEASGAAYLFRRDEGGTGQLGPGDPLSAGRSGGPGQVRFFRGPERRHPAGRGLWERLRRTGDRRGLYLPGLSGYVFTFNLQAVKLETVDSSAA